MRDKCHADIVTLTRPSALATISQERYSSSFSGSYTLVKQITDFFTLTQVSTAPDAHTCAFSSCTLVQATGTAHTDCTDTASSDGLAVTQTGTQLSFVLTTTSVVATKKVCLKCANNENTVSHVKSTPFEFEVTALKCKDHLTFTKVAGTTNVRGDYSNPQVLTGLGTVLNSGWAQTASPTYCPLKYAIIKCPNAGDCNTNLGGTWLTVDTTGKVTVNWTVLGT